MIALNITEYIQSVHFHGNNVHTNLSIAPVSSWTPPELAAGYLSRLWVLSPVGTAYTSWHNG